jgi:hypothetical protein
MKKGNIIYFRDEKEFLNACIHFMKAGVTFEAYSASLSNAAYSISLTGGY